MIFIHFILILTYIVPVLFGCTLVDNDVMNLNGIENEIIYIDLKELFPLE